MSRSINLIVAFALLAPLSLLADNPAKLPTASVRIPHTPTRYEFVQIPGGTVTIPGPEEGDPPVKVDIKPLWVGRTEVTWDCFEIWGLCRDLTQRQSDAAIDAQQRPSRPWAEYQRGFGNDNQPAIGMSYHSVEMYCAWLKQQTGINFRLLTEAEWVHACRAGATTDPKDRETISKYAWFRENSDLKTHTIMTRQPNAWGLYDMLGNAAEYVQKLPNDDIIVKGGSYKDKLAFVNPLFRNKYSEDVWQQKDAQNPKSEWWLSDAAFAGFRLACDQDPTPKQKYP